LLLASCSTRVASVSKCQPARPIIERCPTAPTRSPSPSCATPVFGVIIYCSDFGCSHWVRNGPTRCGCPTSNPSSPALFAASAALPCAPILIGTMTLGLVKRAHDDVGHPAKNRDCNESTGCYVPDRAIMLHRLSLRWPSRKYNRLYELEFLPNRALVAFRYLSPRPGPSDLRPCSAAALDQLARSGMRLFREMTRRQRGRVFGARD
jgi:hypothetical protein